MKNINEIVVGLSFTFAGVLTAKQTIWGFVLALILSIIGFIALEEYRKRY